MRFLLAFLVLVLGLQLVILSLPGKHPVGMASAQLPSDELTPSEQGVFRRWLQKNQGNRNYGPSCKATCRILNDGTCGTGTIVGITEDGYALVLTNAHVAGTRLGHSVRVEVESTGAKLRGRVIMSAYSDRMLADWAILKTTTKYTKVDPVKLNCNRPSGSHYTKGFPSCRAMPAGDVNMVMMSDDSPLAKWKPNSIGGQSGSGVFNDDTGYIEALLTWTWSGHGAGQMTSAIYAQATGKTNHGPVRVQGLEEVEGSSEPCCGSDDFPPVIVENGFFAEANISRLPIWVNEPTGEDQ